MERFSYSRNGVQGRVDENCQVRVQIPQVETIGNKVKYHIRVTNIQTRQSWEVAHRFSEFLKLRNDLIAYFTKAQKKCPGCVNYQKVLLLFEFPRKHMFTSVTPPVLNYRKMALQSFIALLASHTFTTTPKCPTCSGFAFTAVRDFVTEGLLVTNGGGVGGGAASASPSSSAAGTPVAADADAIRETMNAKDFTNYIPVTGLKSVNSDGKFTDVTRAHSSKKKHSQRKYKQQSTSAKSNQAEKQRTHAPRPKELIDDALPSPPHSTASSTASSSNPASPTTVQPTLAPMTKPIKQQKEKFEEEESKEWEDEDDDEAFVSFTASTAASKPTTISKTKSRRNSQENISKRDSIGSNGSAKQVNKRRTTKKHFKFTHSISSRHSMEGVGDEQAAPANVVGDNDEEEFGSVNLDFMNKVAVADK